VSVGSGSCNLNIRRYIHPYSSKIVVKIRTKGSSVSMSIKFTFADGGIFIQDLADSAF
jgi:hypothetical protein